VRAALELRRTSEALGAALLAELGRAPLPSYKWGMPPAKSATAQRRFEYVSRDSPALAAALPDVRAIRQTLRGDGHWIACVDSLDGATTVTVPRPVVGHRASRIRRPSFAARRRSGAFRHQSSP
jgi:hypothetical protein